jgi:flavodoxin
LRSYGSKIMQRNYSETTQEAQKELRENARPKLSNRIENINSYNVVFVGYPNWRGTIPMPVATFLSEYDFSGKTIAPFCTNEGSGLGRSVLDIRKLCPHSTILDGLAVRGSDVKKSQNEVSAWLREIGITKRKWNFKVFYGLTSYRIRERTFIYRILYILMIR